MESNATDTLLEGNRIKKYRILVEVGGGDGMFLGILDRVSRGAMVAGEDLETA